MSRFGYQYRYKILPNLLNNLSILEINKYIRNCMNSKLTTEFFYNEYGHENDKKLQSMTVHIY